MEIFSCPKCQNKAIVKSGVVNRVKEYKIKKPPHGDYHPTYKIFNHLELVDYIKNKHLLSGAGMIITELGDKFMLIKWERFKD